MANLQKHFIFWDEKVKVSKYRGDVKVQKSYNYTSQIKYSWNFPKLLYKNVFFSEKGSLQLLLKEDLNNSINSTSDLPTFHLTDKTKTCWQILLTSLKVY